MTLTLGAFAQIEDSSLGIMLGCAKGGLEEGGARGLIAHEGLEPGGGLAPAPRVQDLVGQLGQNFSGDGRAKAEDGLHERLGLRVQALRTEGFGCKRNLRPPTVGLFDVKFVLSSAEDFSSLQQTISSRSSWSHPRAPRASQPVYETVFSIGSLFPPSRENVDGCGHNRRLEGHMD